MRMQNFTFLKTPINGLTIVQPFYSEDQRGHFLKSFEKEVFANNGIAVDIFEDFETFSKNGVLRGLHFQTVDLQAKLVRVLVGEVFDVAVDLRASSDTYGKWHSEILSEKNRKSLFIPKGFAHGFLVLSDTAFVSYKCDGKYSQESDTGIVWNDNDLNIKWPLERIEKLHLSEKDRSLQTFSEFNVKSNIL